MQNTEQDSPRILQDIRAQADSLVEVVAHQLGSGRSALAEAARLIGERRAVLISGMGSSLYASLPFTFFLNARGISVRSIDSSELLYHQPALARDAAVILVSRSGETIEVTKLLPLLKDQGAVVIGVTNELDSTLAREADCVVWLKSRQDELVAVQTYTATIVTLLTLGAVIAGELNEAWERGLLDVRDAMAKLVPECELASREWVRPFETATVIYLLARGPSMASAFEGSLMLNEAAKIPSVAFSSSNFRHGAIEVVDSAYRGIVFATPGPAQELSLAMARDVIAFGGRAHVIATQPAPPQIPTWRVPEVPAVLMPAVEIIPVQMLTLRLAQSRSIPLGRFRYAAQVTRAEEGSEAAK